MERLEIKSLKPALQELERGIGWVLAQHPDVAVNVTPIIVSGGRRAPKCLGWVRDGYVGDDKVSQPFWSTREGDASLELALVAEHLNRNPIDIMATVVHECVHLAASSRKIDDCAKSGRHNKKFQALAESFGLEITGLDSEGKPLVKSAGYGSTRLSPGLRERVERDFQPDVAAFQVFHNLIRRDKGPQSPRFKCPNCGQVIIGRNASRTHQETNVMCGDCMVKMLKVVSEE